MWSFLLACQESSESGKPPASRAPDEALTVNELPGDREFVDPATLVVSSMDRIHMVAADESVVASFELSDLLGRPCDAGVCRVEGVTADDGGLVLNWALTGGTEVEGGLVRLDPADGTLTTTWQMGGWIYPHELVRYPGTDRFLVADAFLDGVFWIPATGAASADDAVAAVSGVDASPYEAHVPNGLFLIEDEGMIGLLVSYRSNDLTDPAGENGRIVFWDVTEPDAIRPIWAFPPDGVLAAPHDPSLHWRDGRWLLLYAHSHGVYGSGGAVGVAELAHLSEPPTYLADLVPSSGSWRFPRGALLAADDTLLVTDTSAPAGSGADGGGVHRTSLPSAFEPPAVGGEFLADGSRQVFVSVDDAGRIITGLDEAYRSLFWVPTW